MLESQIKTILNRYGATLVTDLKQRLIADDTVATRRALNSLGYQIKDLKKSTSLQVRGKKYIRAIDTGTPKERPYSKMPKRNKILQWIKKKNIKPYDGKMSQKRLAFIIAETIEIKGTINRFRYQGGGTNLIQFVIDKNSEPLTRELFDVIKADFEKQIDKHNKNVNKNKS